MELAYKESRGLRPDIDTIYSQTDDIGGLIA